MRYSLILLFTFLTSVAFCQFSDSCIVYFEVNKYNLTNLAKTALQNLVKASQNKTLVRIEISGFTDADGTNEYNKILAEDRVAAVQQFLVDQNSEKQLFTIKVIGESNPISPNDSELGKSKNRRVTICFKYVEKKNLEIPKLLPVLDISKNIEPVKSFATNRNFIETFETSCDKGFVIKGKKGSLITFPENALMDKNGKTVSGDIKVELIEIQTKSDMILNSIQTTSNKELIESGGTIYLKIFSNNEEVQLNPASSYTIQFSTKNKLKNDMELFYGDTMQQNMNWELPNLGQSSLKSKKVDSKTKNLLTRVFARKMYSPNWWRRIFYRFRGVLYQQNSYVLNSKKLGWINCDRFYGKTNVTNIKINSNEKSDVSFFLVFKSINSVMSANYTNPTGMAFNNVPAGMKVRLIAIKKEANNILYAQQDFKIQKNEIIKITLTKISDDEFNEKMKQFE